jgi:hypothetical protein
MPFRVVRAVLFALIAAVALPLTACKPTTVIEAESKRDVDWLAENGSPEAIAALGRLADTDARALQVLDGRAHVDVNTYIAAWSAVTRSAPWGSTFIRTALADPTRAEMAASALPRRDPRLIPFANDLEAAVVRLAAGRKSAVIAGVLASIGPQAHGAVDRRLVDPKTRKAMCDGIALPEASGDARSLVLAVAPGSRDDPSCVALIIDMAANEDQVLGWLAANAEPGLLTATAKSNLACPRLATVWQKALTLRPPEAHPALAVPLQLCVKRCNRDLDPILGELLTKNPRARATIIKAIDPFGGDLNDMTETCKALRAGYANGESPLIRERARDAVATGCKYTK